MGGRRKNRYREFAKGKLFLSPGDRKNVKLTVSDLYICTSKCYNIYIYIYIYGGVPHIYIYIYIYMGGTSATSETESNFKRSTIDLDLEFSFF